MSMEKRRERGFFGRILVFILTILAIIGLVAMALSVMCPHIDPKHLGWIPFFGLSFWVILFFNALIFFVLLLFDSLILNNLDIFFMSIFAAAKL